MARRTALPFTPDAIPNARRERRRVGPPHSRSSAAGYCAATLCVSAGRLRIVEVLVGGNLEVIRQNMTHIMSAGDPHPV